jgi:hypothetical protein
MAAAQFPGLGIEHLEILEMVDSHGRVSASLRPVCPMLICRRQWASHAADFDGALLRAMLRTPREKMSIASSAD